MLWVSFLPKSAQVVIYRIISIVFLVPTIALFSDGYYVVGFVAALASGAIMGASFVVAKWVRDEKETERLKAQAQAAMSAQSPHAPYAPGQSLPPLPPMPNRPTGQSWSSVPLPAPPPDVLLPGTIQQTPEISLPKRASAASSSQAWIAPTLTLVGMALFVALGAAYLGVMARRSDLDTPILLSAQNGNRGVSSPQPIFIPEHRVEKRVLALYYPWYRTPQHSHRWEHQTGVDAARRHIASHAHYPTQGPYDSTDAAVLDRHLEEAEQAGIDTLVCSWWGQKDATDSALRLLQRAARTPIKICVLWEQPPGQAGTDALATELTYLLETFGKQPAFMRVGDKPVVFVFNRVVRSVEEDGWGYVRQAGALRVPPGAFLLSDGVQSADSTAWSGYFLLGAAAPLIDGQSPAVCARAQDREYANVVQASRPAHRLSVVTVFPGYDDRKPNATLHIAARTYLDRQGGQLYDALWQQAIADDPDWILVNSFNQWHAGTEIEPSVEMGDKYLRLTRQYAAQFKRQAGTTK